VNILGNLMARIFGHGDAAAVPAPAAPTESTVAAAPAVSTVVVDVDAVLEGMAATMQDSATMNILLHKHVLQTLADNGGKIPASLLN
jgi:hypothetical protein